MLKDAELGKFDLIITREVSRFARNTVDTLQETRKLKKLGIEVYFIEDNIWTIKDNDGELRLTIMATLAQNESKKTSDRVKAGQKISFENAVPYGNGNILGYDRIEINKEVRFVINPEQAETVRLIYELYLSGNGIRKIQFELERLGRKTSTGLTRWQTATISRILNNSFYCGIIVYRKQFVPDYLEQKKINNFDDDTKIIVEGHHEPIISKEDYYKVREMLDNKTISTMNRGKRGKHTSNDVWVSKLRCSCGCTFNRRVWRYLENGPQYSYQCYSSVRSGTYATRLKKGLSVEGVCKTPMIPEWKLGTMADVIFRKFWSRKNEALKIAMQLLEETINIDSKDYSKEISSTKAKIEKISTKLDTLLDMRLENEITREVFDNKREKLIQERENLIKLLENYETESPLSQNDIDNKLKVLKHGLENDFDFTDHQVPDEIIDAFVDEIICDEDGNFVWKLNLLDNPISYKLDGTKKKHVLVECPTDAKCNTGCHWQCRKVKSKYTYLHKLVITRHDVNEYLLYHPKYKKANKFEDINCKILI